MRHVHLRKPHSISCQIFYQKPNISQYICRFENIKCSMTLLQEYHTQFRSSSCQKVWWITQHDVTIKNNRKNPINWEKQCVLIFIYYEIFLLILSNALD